MDQNEHVPAEVLVAIPAHNEAATIGVCLTSVITSLTAAQQLGVVGRARIAVALHRCTDDTEAVVQTAGSAHNVELMIVAEDQPMPVGTVRTRLVRAAHGDPPDHFAWLLSTDADTVVPLHWVDQMLAIGRREQAELVLGLADLTDWDVSPEIRGSYAAIIDAGLTPTGHRHAYAANLAIRLSAFHQVGGFPGLVHGEEHGLARAVRAAGLTVATPLAPRVLTSARMPGRAHHGLGTLLEDLAHHPDERTSDEYHRPDPWLRNGAAPGAGRGSVPWTRAADRPRAW